MAEYTVYSRPGYGPEGAIFVREGFSVNAFLFTVLWALWHRMWLAAAILLALTVLVSAGAKYLGLSEALTALSGLTINLIFGIIARDLKARSLQAAGYGEAGLSLGRNLEEAEIRYFHGLEEVPISVQRQARTIPPLKAPDTLGIFSNV